MPDFGIDLSDEKTRRALVFALAGLGRTVGQGQGVAESLGGFTQNLIATSNLQDLIKSLSGQAPAPTAETQTTSQITPKTTPTGSTSGVGKVAPSRITIEGTDLTEIGKTLSGINISEPGASNFLLPR